MLAELRLRYENDESPRLRKTVRVFVESGITVIAVETENEDDGSDYDCGWVVASADSVVGTIGNVGEAIIKEDDFEERRSAEVRVRA